MCECSVKQCCCGCSLRTGSLAIGVVCFIFDVIFLILTILVSVYYPGTSGIEISGWISVAIYALHGLMCGMLIWGVVESKTGLCMIWVIGSIVFVVFEIILGLVIITYASIGMSAVNALGVPIANAVASVYLGPVIAAGVFMILLTGIHIYFIIVIRSFCRSIEGGAGQIYPVPY